MNFPLRILSGVPLVVMAGALLLLAVQSQLARPAPAGPWYPQMLIEDGRLEEAVALHELFARNGDPRALRALAAVGDLADQPGKRATALQGLVHAGAATLNEHIEAASTLAAAGALKEALTVLYNAERRFPDDVDSAFLGFYGALARDAGRPDIALPLARRLWKKTGSDDVMKVMVSLGAG